MLPLWRRRRRSAGAKGRKWPFEDPRWSLPHTLAILKVGGEEDRRTLLGYAQNISCNGMMIGSIWPKEVGTRLQVEFALPEPADLIVRCTCEVAWTRPHSVDPSQPGMGLKFLDLPASAARSLESLYDGERSLRAPANRTWSEYDQAWIPWTPQASR